MSLSWFFLPQAPFTNIHALPPGHLLVSCKGLCFQFCLCSVSIQIFIFFLSPVFYVLDPENGELQIQNALSA